jgi:hypothetical protein
VSTSVRIGIIGAGSAQFSLALAKDLCFAERLASSQGEIDWDIADWAKGPFRGGIYDPVLDDGVKMNIMPLQEAEVLRYRNLV